MSLTTQEHALRRIVRAALNWRVVAHDCLARTLLDDKSRELSEALDESDSIRQALAVTPMTDTALAYAHDLLAQRAGYGS
ncbi:hypothetical protein [Rhizobium sp. FKL33]|uniref:hypothetical protein n=1 Tax=Rhizobium sp. FKL33 TaxID=2562307 RepID=UPI0010BFECB5|nr:hypothetical protein [Rhizobium sp. FKL33]